MTTKNDYYWNQAKWEVNQNGEGVRISPLVAIMIAPLLGGLFVVFMPFIGLALFAQHLAKKTVSLVRPLFQTTMAPIALPGEAHLTGSRSEGVKESAAAEDTLEKLSKEIQARREE